jgi:hypothetical protein
MFKGKGEYFCIYTVQIRVPIRVLSCQPVNRLRTKFSFPFNSSSSVVNYLNQKKTGGTDSL